MNSERSNRRFPADLGALLFPQPILVGWIILTTVAFCDLDNFLRSSAEEIFWSGFGLGMLGIVILFFARLPLYCQGKFFSIGPKQLPSFHKRLYWIAYAIVAAAVVVLGFLWWRIV